MRLECGATYERLVYENCLEERENEGMRRVQQLKVKIDVGGNKMKVLLNTGSSYTLINELFLKVIIGTGC